MGNIIEKSIDKPTDKPTERPTDKPTEKSIDKSIDRPTEKSTTATDGNSKNLKPLLPAKSKSRPTSRAISTKKEANSDTPNSALTSSSKDLQGTVDEQKMTAPNLAGSRLTNNANHTPEVQEEQQLMSMPRDVSTKEQSRVSQDVIVDHAIPTTLKSVSPSTDDHKEFLNIIKEQDKEQDDRDSNATIETTKQNLSSVTAFATTTTANTSDSQATIAEELSLNAKSITIDHKLGLY